MAILERVRKCDGVTVYLIDFRDQKGRRVRELAGTTRKQAKDLYAKRLGEVKSGTYVNPRDKDKEDDCGPTFESFCEQFLRDHPGRRRSNHYPTMVKRLLPYFKGKHVREITRGDLDRLRIRLQTEKVERLGRPLCSTSVLKLLRTVHRVFKQAVRWGVIDYNPAADLEKPSVPMHKTRYLSADERTRLHEQAPPWLKPMLTLALATGMRLKEVTKVRWDEVDKQAGVLHVSEETKTGSRAIPLNATALKVIDEQVRHVRSAYVFTTSTGDNYDNDKARDHITSHGGQSDGPGRRAALRGPEGARALDADHDRALRAPRAAAPARRDRRPRPGAHGAGVAGKPHHERVNAGVNKVRGHPGGHRGFYALGRHQAEQS